MVIIEGVVLDIVGEVGVWFVGFFVGFVMEFG